MNQKECENSDHFKLNPCSTCKYLHIGQNVAHNHCDFSRYESDWHHARSNGRNHDIVCQDWRKSKY